MGELLKKITEEINKTGFPLEMRVSKLLKNKGYYVNQSAYYIDIEEEKSRELDIKAHINRTYINKKEKKTYVRNNLIIECKKSENKPWVFLSSQRDFYDDNDLLNLLVFSYKEDSRPFSLTSTKIIKKEHIFNEFKTIARSYFEAFKGAESSEAIFKAITTVVKATLYFSKDNRPENILLNYPIIVFDGKMFDSVLTENGEINVWETNAVLLTFQYASTDFTRTFTIPIVREDFLPELIDRLEQSLEHATKLLEQE